MDKIKYAPQVEEDKDKQDMAKVFEGFFKSFPQLNGFTPIIRKDISFSSTVTPNWACIWNKPAHIGKIATPLAIKGDFVLVVIHEDKQTEIYRSEDLDQIIKPKSNGTT